MRPRDGMSRDEVLNFNVFLAGKETNRQIALRTGCKSEPNRSALNIFDFVSPLIDAFL
jgi:hypothetical protein